MLVRFERPGERSADVVVIVFEAFEPFDLIPTASGIEGIIRQSDEELGVAFPPGITFSGVREFA